MHTDFLGLCTGGARGLERTVSLFHSGTLTITPKIVSDANILFPYMSFSFMDYFVLLKLINQSIEATFPAQNFPLYPTMPSDNSAYYGVSAQCVHGSWNVQQEMLLELGFKS